MAWVSENYLWFVIGGVIVIGLSLVRVSLRKPPNSCGVTIGAILLGLVIIAGIFVANAPPGDPVGPDPSRPGPRPPIPATTLERLRQPWHSVATADWPAAETLATISNLAYLSPVDANESYLMVGFNKFMPIVSGSMIGYVLSVDNVSVIAFRGTDAGDSGDWLANLNSFEMKTPFGPIHDGFYEAYMSMKPQIVKLLAERKPDHLWITGHSLGGALAVVAAFDLIDTEKRTVDGLITFGQPMVAKAQLAGHLNKILFDKYAYFVNDADIVPRVPPGFAHCGSMVWFTNGGVIRSKRIRPVFGEKSEKAEVIETEPKITPLSEAEFEKVKSEIILKKADLKRLPDGKVVYQGNLPLIRDHSMDLYLEKVRKLVGVSNLIQERKK
jgi:hypothetical protein